ncbi:MAG TPA: citrate/2-methylcitrate synthase [Ilumatobacteraceae bacterium]|nr:citrate/2-methylcitrate synthase [Ilumatobacteraceae bacterium]
MSTLIDVPAGLNGVAVTDTSIGDVDGEAGFFHYRGQDATELARHRSFEEVWHLVAVGHLPDDEEVRRFAAAAAAARRLPASLLPVLAPLAQARGATLGSVRAAVSIAADELGLRPLIDLAPAEREAQALRLSAVIPSIVAALHRAGFGLPPVEWRDDLGHAADYLRLVTGEVPDPAAARALEQYLILTIDHGFNASTFTARVVASTGADLADVVGAALGALAGPLHGGAPGRALDALDAIGDPARTEAWVEREVAAGRRIMGFGHAVYRTRDPRSALLRDVATGLGGDLVDVAVDVEGRVLETLRRLKPDRPLPSNVEFFAGVVMASAGLPRALFTPTFAVSRTIGWTTHAVEQAAEGKLIRPSARYVGPSSTP